MGFALFLRPNGFEGTIPASKRAVMESRSKVFGHPLHTLLIVFPLGLLMASLVFDFLGKKRKTGDDAKIARALVGFGVLSGLVAALPGIWDYLAIPANTRAKRIGSAHAVGNVIMLSLFAISWKKRRPQDNAVSNSALGLSLAGATLGGLTGWLGGELVYRLGIGVDKGAHPEAPNSLFSDKA